MDEPLAKLDELIAALNAIIDEPEEEFFKPVAGTPNRRATLRVLIKGSIRDQVRQPTLQAEAVLYDGTNLFMRGANEPVRNSRVEVRIAVGKTPRGEAFRFCVGIVQGSRRVSGGYEYLIRVDESRREMFTAAQRLRECLEKKDPLAWERWCADLVEGVDLRGVDLRRAPLARFDLCCANLSGADLSDADLSGANLSGANLERVHLERARVAGTDFFRARLPRRFSDLVRQSGLMEERSVQFCED